MTKRDSFLEAVLGISGAAVLDRLSKASPELAAYLLPRAAVAWVNSIGASDLPWALPGVPDQRFVLAKRGDRFVGVAEVGGLEYAFDGARPEHVAAVIAVSLGAPPGQPDLREVDLARLGKTVDALVKAQKKGGAEAGTGLHAGAIAPTPPAAPTPTAPPAPKAGKSSKPKLPKVGKPAQATKPKPLKLSVSESRKPCGVCGKTQFRGAEFTGCTCFADLAKGVDVSIADHGAGFELGLTSEWDHDAIFTFLEAVGRR